MKWINILGFVLQFLSFWLAAPELLGSESLKRFESGLIKFLSRLPSILLGLAGLIIGISMSIYGIYYGISAADEGASNPLTTMYLIIGFSTAYMIYIIFFYKKVQNWIERIFARPLINNLIINQESRKIALIIGAVLFTIGFLCQLIVLILS